MRAYIEVLEGFQESLYDEKKKNSIVCAINLVIRIKYPV